MTFFDAEESAEVLASWARELGVSEAVMLRLVEQRRALVYDVAAEPRAWGFDLLGSQQARRDITNAFRSLTHLTGVLPDSFLSGHAPLIALVPNPLTMPDGRPLDQLLVQYARLSAEAADDLARQLRVTIQLTLGRPLTHEAVGRAVRETAWDHDLDAAHVTSRVEQVLAEVL